MAQRKSDPVIEAPLVEGPPQEIVQQAASVEGDIASIEEKRQATIREAEQVLMKLDNEERERREWAERNQAEIAAAKLFEAERRCHDADDIVKAAHSHLDEELLKLDDIGRKILQVEHARAKAYAEMREIAKEAKLPVRLSTQHTDWNGGWPQMVGHALYNLAISARTKFTYEAYTAELQGKEPKREAKPQTVQAVGSYFRVMFNTPKPANKQ